MKLLILLSSITRGGVEEYALKIAEEAKRKKWDSHIAFPETDGTNSLIQDLQVKQISYYPLDIAEKYIPPVNTIKELIQTILPRLEGIVEKWLHFWRILFFLWQLKPQVVMLNIPWADQCLTSILACGILKIPTLVVFHLIPFKFTFSNITLKAYHWAYSRNQQWMGISENNRKFIAESFSLPQTEILCVNNGTKVEFPQTLNNKLDQKELRDQVRIELGIPEKSPIILTVARLSSQKGYDYLIPTIPHFLQEFRNLYFVWVGDGEQKEFLCQQIQEYAIAERVLLLGHRCDIPRLLQAADLFVFPTYYEGQPFAILEAMAFNLPIIASATNGIPEVIKHQTHGLLTRTGDSCDLLEAIRWALRHPRQMQEMATLAKQRVKEFSETKMLAQTFEILQNVNSERKRKSPTV
jgi:glycosyltransferase involved in cell wall biosynthesis